MNGICGNKFEWDVKSNVGYGRIKVPELPIVQNLSSLWGVLRWRTHATVRKMQRSWAVKAHGLEEILWERLERPLYLRDIG